MSNEHNNKNQILAVRATKDFIKKFDELCDRLGYCRSDVVRYALKQFFNSHWNNSENFRTVRKEMY